MANNLFNHVAELRGLDELTAGERVESLVRDAREILADAFTDGIDKIGLNAVMYDDFAPKILDAVEAQAHSGVEFGLPPDDEMPAKYQIDSAEEESYKDFCREVIKKIPEIRVGVESGKYPMPDFSAAVAALNTSDHG